nr:MAG TPA: hypothetical protein [Bacteriophage sp.]
MNREVIYGGVFDWLRTHAGDDVRTWSRRLRHWNDVPEIEQPAVFLAQNGEQIDRLRAVWTLRMDVYVYVSVGGDENAVTATPMNHIIDKIADALRPRRELGETEQTLGGLILDCRIEGKIETDAGVLGAQSVAIIPLVILAED